MRSQYRRALRFVRPYAWRLTGVTLTGMLATSLTLAQPYFSKLLIDNALLSRNLRALVWIAAAMAIVTIAGFALNMLSSYQYVRISAHLLFDIRLTLYRHLQRCSPRFWARNRLGDVVSRINNDVAEVQRIAADALVAACANIVFLIGAAAIMIWFSPTVFLLSTAALPVSVWALRRYKGRLANHARQVRERSADIGSFLIETLTGFRLVAASNTQAYEAERFQRHNRSFVDALLHLQFTSFLAGALPGTVLTLSTSAVFLYGGRMVIDGALTPGSLVALMAYHVRLLGPIQNLLGLYNGLVTGSASLARLFELLDTPIEVQDAVASPPRRFGGEIRFENVSFQHDGHPVLENVSAAVEPGSSCAIVGPSGAGKSTLADLPVRFYDPTEGRIFLDGCDVREIPLRDLRDHVVLVDQSAFVFHASVRENIRYGSPGATDAEIESAARAAAIHDRIAAMPQGYETLVGERGLTLSAGERHRITLARALLRKPAVLVLDEPTAALDETTEREMMAAIASAMRGRTSILITHRPALAALCDQTILLDQGRARVVRGADGVTVRVGVVDSGIHAEHPHIGRIHGGVSFAGEGLTDRIGHGTAVAAAIRDHAPEAELYAVRVFDRHLRTDIDTLIRGIQWCFDHGMHLVNLSAGTENEAHRAALAEVIARAGAAQLVSAARTLPGSLPGVIAVEADPNLARDEIRHPSGVFLASPFPRDIPGVPRERNLSGVSFAVANVTGLAARRLAQGDFDIREALRSRRT